MAARSLLLSLTRNARRETKIHFKSISSSIEAVTTTHEESADEFTDEEKTDDLKSRIFRLRLPKRSVTNVLQKWIGEGNTVTVSDLRTISKDLRKSQRYKHALEISEWMISHEEYQLTDSDYAIRINLMTQVFGIDGAERYFEALPPSVKTNETYTALLHSYASLKLVEKAEHLYRKITNITNLSLTALTFNELMTLYISVGQLEKIPLIAEEMRSFNVAPDLFTYNLRLSCYAADLKMEEARSVVEEMSSDLGCCDESWIRYLKLAKVYISAGELKDSDVSSSLVESEKGVVTQRELISYDFLVILHGGLGNKDMIDRIWKSLRMTGQKMMGRNYVCVLSSYLVLGYLREAGDVIDQWKESATSEFSPSVCGKILEAFTEFGMVDEKDSFCVVLREKGCEPFLDELK